MEDNLSSLTNLITSLYTDQYYTAIDLKRDLTLNRINLSKYAQSYTGDIPEDLRDRLTPIVKESQVKKFIQLTIAENLNRDFSKHLSASYRRKFKEREAYLLAQALAPVIAKNFYPQSIKGSKKKYVTGLEGLQKELKRKSVLYLSVIERQLKTLYTKGYMYALDENLNPIIVDGKIQLLKDHEGIAIRVAPLDDKKFKTSQVWEFIMDNNARRKRKRSKIFSVPSSWKLIGDWERYLLATHTNSKSTRLERLSAELSREQNPLLKRLVKENTQSYFGLLNKTAKETTGRVVDSNTASIFKTRKINKFLINERRYSVKNLIDNTSGVEKFSDEFDTTLLEKKKNLEASDSTGKFTFGQILKNKINNTRISKRLRGVNSVEATKRPYKRKKRRPLKILDVIVALPGILVAVVRLVIDKAIFSVAQYVGEKEGITYSLLRNVGGGDVYGRVLTSLDGLRFSFGIVKMIAKDGIEALVPAILSGILVSSPTFGAVIGGAYFASKFFLDFTQYFSTQNPLVVNMVDRISSSMTERVLSLPEIIANSGTFGVTIGVVGTILASLLGISGAPLLFTGLGIFGAATVIKAIDLSVVGRFLPDYTAAIDLTKTSFFFKSEYLFEYGGSGLIVGVLGMLFTGSPLFLGLAGAGFLTGSIADFVKSSLFEDSVLHDLSGISAYDITHVGIGFAGGVGLIGFAILGPIGIPVGIAIGAAAGIGSTFYTKRISRIVAPIDEKWITLDKVHRSIGNWKDLSRDDFFEKLKGYGYSDETLAKFGGGQKLFDYIHNDKLIDLHEGYIADQFRMLNESERFYRQDLLRNYHVYDPINQLKDTLDNLPKNNLPNDRFSIGEENLKFDIKAPPELIEELKSLYDREFKTIDELRSEIQKKVDAFYIDKTGISPDTLESLKNSSVDFKSGAALRVKVADIRLNSIYKLRDILGKDPTAVDFINPETLRVNLYNLLKNNADLLGKNAELQGELGHSVQEFLDKQGIDLSKYKVEDMEELETKIRGLSPNFGDFSISSTFYDSQVGNLLSTAGVWEEVFPEKFGTEAMDGVDTAHFNLQLSADDAGRIAKADFPEITKQIITNSDMGSVSKLFAYAQNTVLDKLGLTSTDLMKGFNSGIMGGVLISVAFGVTNPVGIIMTIGAYTAARYGLAALSKVYPELSGVEALTVKGVVGNAIKFGGEGLNAGLLGFVVGSYFFGPLGGGLIALGTGVGWSITRFFIEKSSSTIFARFSGVMEHVLNPVFIIYTGAEVSQISFLKGLFGANALQNWLTLGFGAYSILSLAGVTILGTSGILAIGLGAFTVSTVSTGLLIFGGVLFGGSLIINWLLDQFLHHGIFYYVGEFLKGAIRDITGWFFKSASIAAIGLDVLIGIIALFFKGEFDIDDFLRTIFIMVFGWAIMMSLMGSGATSGGNNNNTANVVNHKAPHAATFLYTSGKIVNIQNNPSNSLADTVFIKTSVGIVKINTTNPYLYKGEVLNKGEYLGQ